MEITYMVIVTFVAFVAAEILKIKSIPSRFIPLVNLGVGIVAAAISLIFGVLPNRTPVDILSGIILCVVPALGAGGFYDLLKTKAVEKQVSELDYKEAVQLYGEPPKAITEKPVNHSPEEAVLPAIEPDENGGGVG